MPRQIRIDEPGDGDQIMRWCDGAQFRPGTDHSVASYRDGKLLGGFVLTQYMGHSIAVHDGACDHTWCSRDILWMMFHYVFRQLKCGKLLALVASDNYRALAIDLRAGFILETVIRDAIRPGVHLMVLTMTATNCRWLDIIPQQYLPGQQA